MTEVTPPRPPQPSQYALMNGSDGYSRESPECDGGGGDSASHTSMSRQHSFPKKPPRRSISPPRQSLTALRASSSSTTTTVTTINNDNSPPPTQQAAPVAASGPTRPTREPPKKPMLPPGYISRYRDASDLPNSSRCVPVKTKSVDSAEVGPSCPSGKPIRPAKPPAKYKLKVDALQQQGAPAPPTTSTASGGSERSERTESNASTSAGVPVVRGTPAKPPRKVSLSPSPSRDDIRIRCLSPSNRQPLVESGSDIELPKIHSVQCLPMVHSCHSVLCQPEACDDYEGAGIPKHVSQPALPVRMPHRRSPGSKVSDGGGYAGTAEDYESDESGVGDRDLLDGFTMIKSPGGTRSSVDSGACSDATCSSTASSVYAGAQGSSSVQSRKAKFEARIMSIRRAPRAASKNSVVSQDSAGDFSPAADLASTKHGFRAMGKRGNKKPEPMSPPVSRKSSKFFAGDELNMKESSLTRWASSEQLTSSPSVSKVELLTSSQREASSSSTLPRRYSTTSGEGAESKSSPLLKNLKKRARPEFLAKKFGGHSPSPTPRASSSGLGSAVKTPSSRRGSMEADKVQGAEAAAATAVASPVTAKELGDTFRPKLRPVPLKAQSTEEEDSDSDDAECGSSLFQYVYVISLVKDDVGKYAPQVSYRFPPKLSDSDASSKDEGLQSISAFCFPDLECWTEPVSTYKSETFSFILTDIGGSKRFGYCRRLLPSKKRPCMPEVYCIISPLGCFSLYSKILDQVEQRLARSSSAVFAFLKAVIAKPFPGPGRKVVVAAFGAGGSGMETVVLKRPKDSAWLEHVDFEVLTSKVPCHVLLKVFAAVIMERHLIFVAERLSTLSSCILACVALIYPFEWQHVFIPVLPACLIDICCSPLPYIIGVMKTSLPTILSGDLPIEENVVIVDLDEGRLLTEVLNDVGTMPNKHRSELESSLKSAYSKPSKDVSDRKQSQGAAIVDACLKFFVQTTGHYRKCFKSTDELEFDFPMFVKSGGKSCSEFLSMLTKTQMFDMFIQEKCDPVNVTSAALGMFEQAVVENYGQAEDYLSGRSAFKLHKQAKAKLKGFIKKS